MVAKMASKYEEFFFYEIWKQLRIFAHELICKM